ncbi:MAG: hypothetical protein WAV00_02285 [Nocardioides sp.]
MNRAQFLVVWALVDVAVVVFALFMARSGLKGFDGAAVTRTRTGESQDDAEARVERLTWRIVVLVVALTGLLCYAFIVWQAALLY